MIQNDPMVAAIKESLQMMVQSFQFFQIVGHRNENDRIAVYRLKHFLNDLKQFLYFIAFTDFNL